MARRRRGRCDRKRRLRRWSFADLQKSVVSAFQAWQRFMWKDFLTLGTALRKDYEKDEIKMEEDEQVKSMEKRFDGYKSICLFGLGSLFWGSATGVLGQLEEKDKNGEKVIKDPPVWMNFCFAYSAFALVFMLLGVASSTFPKSCWMASSIAGFGSLQALILVLGGFHVASLKYHPYLKHCGYSMACSTVVMTLYWGMSVQDPLVLHVLVKLIVWLISIMLYGVFKFVCLVWNMLCWLFGPMCTRIWNFLCSIFDQAWTKVCSHKQSFMAWFNAANAYQPLPQVAPVPP